MPTLDNSNANRFQPAADRFQRLAAVARYATVALFVSMFVATHIPVRSIPFQISLTDKALHCLIYMALSFSVLTSWEWTIGLLRPQHYFTVWLLGTLYGAFDEVTQIPVGRNCDGLDWVCDILGIVLGLTLFRLVRPLLYRLTALTA